MLNHQRLHTGDYKECICDLCGAVYKSVQVLNRHVRNAHQDLRNHKCLHCDKAFHNKQRLERHINSQHTKAKVWPCPVCHSRYDRKDNLRTHIRKNHGNVVDADRVELHSVDNCDSQAVQLTEVKPRGRAAVVEAVVNPETGELEGGPVRSAVLTQRTTGIYLQQKQIIMYLLQRLSLSLSPRSDPECSADPDSGARPADAEVRGGRGGGRAGHSEGRAAAAAVPPGQAGAAGDPDDGGGGGGAGWAAPGPALHNLSPVVHH